LPLLSTTPRSITEQSFTSVVQPSGSTSTATNIMQKVVQVTDLSPNNRTNHTSDLVGVVEISGSTIRVCYTAIKHIAESGTGHRPFIQLCTSKWSNHLGFHPLPSQVSVLENTSTLGCKRDISHKTNHTSALVDVVETVVQPSGFTPLQPNIMQNVVQVTDLSSTLHIEVVKPYRFPSTSNTSEHTYRR
jgi:hypothetical protein